MFTRLPSVLSHSRFYSTGPNKHIIDLLTQCTLASCRSQCDPHPWPLSRFKRRGFQPHTQRVQNSLLPVSNCHHSSTQRAHSLRTGGYQSTSLVLSTRTPLFIPPQLRGIGLGIANRIEFFLKGSEYVCRHVQTIASASFLILHRFHRTRGGRTDCLLSRSFKSSPGLGILLIPQLLSTRASHSDF
jgi:hypothetical protein